MVALADVADGDVVAEVPAAAVLEARHRSPLSRYVRTRVSAWSLSVSFSEPLGHRLWLAPPP